ncbi:hypothetical protein [Paenibacillus kobensis]|uniref:hypothetical protein n=1 Tax=Paenibacillus kobensis TaxID=59841 RepID=UPI000FDC71CF|nr:hypothetical protein [Paenibacillus kobensis]
MRRPIILAIILALMLLAASACSKWPGAFYTGEEKTAAAYVKARGYKIVSDLGEAQAYTLSRDHIVQLPYMQYWAVQKDKPDPYFGKTITSYAFVVTSHPLESKFDSHYAAKEYEIRVVIMLSEGRAVGGYSFPIRKDGMALAGGVYSMEGETLEEITGLNYSEWLEDWEKRYGEYQSAPNAVRVD